MEVKQFGQEHGIEQLLLPTWQSENEYEAWKMLALALKICESAHGTYRGPAEGGTTMIFMTFGPVTTSTTSTVKDNKKNDGVS